MYCNKLQAAIGSNNEDNFLEVNDMDILEKLYLKAKEQYHPEDVSPFVYTLEELLPK